MNTRIRITTRFSLRATTGTETTNGETSRLLFTTARVVSLSLMDMPRFTSGGVAPRFTPSPSFSTPNHSMRLVTRISIGTGTELDTFYIIKVRIQKAIKG